METDSNPKARRTYFIDSENHINTCLQGIEALTENDLVVVFHRESNLSQKQKESIKDSPARIEWILCQDSGVKNSLDVQLIAELSRRIACHELENGYIVSQDQGYKPAIHYLLNRYGDEFRFLGLKKSIDEFMLADALVSAETRQDVLEAFVRVSGQIIGGAMYRNIRDLFDGTTDADEPEDGFTVEGAPLFPEPATETAQQNGNGAGNGGGNGGAQRSKSSKRRKSRSAAKPATANGAAVAANSAQSAEAAKTDETEKDGTVQPVQQPKPRRAPSGRRKAVQPEAAEHGVPEHNAKSVESQPEQIDGQAEAPEAKPLRTRRARQKQNPAESVQPDKAPESEASQPSEEAAPEIAPAQAESEAEKQPSAKPARRGRRKAAQPDAPHTAQTPLTNLPGIGKALAARLESVGIASAEELKDKGSKASWVLLKRENPATSINWLYALEGAILGIAVKELDDATKTALKSFSKLAM